MKMRLAETEDLMMSDCRNCGYITCIISELQLLNTEPLKLTKTEATGLSET